MGGTKCPETAELFAQTTKLFLIKHEEEVVMTFINPITSGVLMQGTLLLASATGPASEIPAQGAEDPSSSVSQLDNFIQQAVHPTLLQASAQGRQYAPCKSAWRLTETVWEVLEVYGDRLQENGDPRGDMIILEKSLAMAGGPDYREKK